MAGKRSGQRGFSFLLLLYIVGTLSCVLLVGAQVFPTYVEYQAAVKAIGKAKDAATVVEVRRTFDNAAAIDNITAITGKDLEIGKQGDQVVVAFNYNKEIHLFSFVYLLMKYSATTAK